MSSNKKWPMFQSFVFIVSLSVVLWYALFVVVGLVMGLR